MRRSAPTEQVLLIAMLCSDCAPVPIMTAKACAIPVSPRPRCHPWPATPREYEISVLGCCGVPAGGASCCMNRQPPSASLHLPAWPAVHSSLLRMQPGYGFAPLPLPASYPLLHMFALARRGAVASARRLDVMRELIFVFFIHLQG